MYLWYVPTLDPRKGVLGVYDHPAPSGSEVRSVPITEDAGTFVGLAARGALRLTRLRDALESALPFDLP